MLEIGWQEMLVIAIVMIVVVQPKDLPGMLRTIGRSVTKLRRMAGDFQRQFNDALQEAELDDVKKSVDTLRGLNPAAEIKKQLNPFEKAAADVRSGLDNMMKPTSAPSAQAETHPVEPLKAGATNMPAAVEKPAEAAPPVPAVSKARPAKAVAAKTAPAKAAAKPADKPAKKAATRKSA